MIRFAVLLGALWLVARGASDKSSLVLQGVLPRLSGTPDLTIGGEADLREEYVFSDVRGLALDPQQRIVVADIKDHNVRVFSPLGVHLYTIGRKGGGPADLLDPCCIAIASDGRLWVKELGNRRFSVFELGSQSARFIRSIRSAPNPSGLLDRVAWDAHGRVVDIASGHPKVTDRAAFVRFFVDSSGLSSKGDTLLGPPDDSLATKTIERCTGDGCSGATYAQPYGPTALWAFGPRGETAQAVSSRYSVSWSAATGARIALLQGKGEYPLLSARERAGAERTLEAIARNARVARSSLPFGVPDRKMPLRSLGFDLDGRLWVERSVADGEPRRADVYDRTGRLVGTMAWPADIRLTLWSIRGTTALGIGVDSLGTNRVVRLQFR